MLAAQGAAKLREVKIALRLSMGDTFIDRDIAL